MKPFRLLLKHRLYISLFFLVVFIALMIHLVQVFEADLTTWIPIILLITLLLGMGFVNYIYRPFALLIESIDTGLDCLRDNDFSISLKSQKYAEFQNSIDSYNQLANLLRTERMELHQRELLLDAVIQSTSMAIVLTSSSGVIVYSNLAARKLFDYSRRLDSLKFETLLHKLPNELKLATENKQEGLYYLHQKDEKKIYYLTCQKFQLNSQTHYLYLYKNMTSEVTREELLIWKKVIRLISHELNNSLAPIHSLTNSAKRMVQQKSEDEESLLDILDTIDRRSHHLHEFIEKYARFSRLPDPQIKEVDMERFISNLGVICDLTVEINGDISNWRFDTTQIEQVLINLVKNSRESGSDDTKIRLLVVFQPEHLKFIIKDRGKGMTEEQLKQSILPFFTTKHTGSGLGLALSHEIVTAHRGKLRMYNRHNGGLKTEIDLPL